MSKVNQCPFCGIREASRAELEIHLSSDHPGRIWNDRMPEQGVQDDPDLGSTAS